MARPQFPTTHSAHQRVPRKTASYHSLGREWERSTPPTAPGDVFDQTGTAPSLSKLTYFDLYPRPRLPELSPQNPKDCESGRDSPAPLLLDEPTFLSASRRQLQPKNRGDKQTEESSFAFPTFEWTEDGNSFFESGEMTPKAYSRHRSRTGPERSSWVEVASLPTLRLSGSTHHDTPPRTPIDDPSSCSLSENYPTVVAPVSGVETMDALVDGMTGGDEIHTLAARTSSRMKHRNHPLYQPPLPTPPAGVVLGGGKIRPPLRSRVSSDEDDEGHRSAPINRVKRRRPRINSQTSPQSLTVSNPSSSFERRPYSAPSISENSDCAPKSVAPSISDIIKAHAPPEAQIRSRPSGVRSASIYEHSHGSHPSVQREDVESEPEPLTASEEAEMMSRSSVDSLADEIKQTLRTQKIPKFMSPQANQVYSFPRHPHGRNQLSISDNASVASPWPDSFTDPSAYSLSASPRTTSPFDSPSLLGLNPPTTSQAVAQYLHSARLTTLLKLTRSPHASQDNPLTVSLSDLGSPTGHPLVVFLGLGCVRHIMGLYDEMAECLGLRLITIDRWGLGRTEGRSKCAKGIRQWASVVEEVLDKLHIDQVSVMAHSGGTPYALSFANKFPKRIAGDISLLAPWVGGSDGANGYKWLKYVPNGILKTAQAAEWKVQAWMIGKPPTLAYKGIGYTSIKPSPLLKSSSPRHTFPQGSISVVYPSVNDTKNANNRSRPSVGSGGFSEYDDLGDFEGRFSSKSTLGAVGGPRPLVKRIFSESQTTTKRKTSKGFLDRLKGGSSSSQPQSPTDEKVPFAAGRKLKALRSMSSLRGRTSRRTSSNLDKESPSPVSPSPMEGNSGTDELGQLKSSSGDYFSTSNDRVPFGSPKVNSPPSTYSRVNSRRSISFTSSNSSPYSYPGSPVPSTYEPSLTSIGVGSAYQAALGNALIAASHAESAKGTHNDLLQILNHDNHPLGFSYSSYPHKVQVWYGDKDERIAENAVRWMEKTMGEDRCSVKVVTGADHGLMYKTSVVVEVMERVADFRRNSISYY